MHATGTRKWWAGLASATLALSLVACTGGGAATPSAAGSAATPDATSGGTPGDSASQEPSQEPSQDPIQDHGFSDGDVLTMITGTSPGGGFDFNLRTLQPFLEEHLQDVTGADVRVIVENVPGGGQRVGYEQMARSDPDGLTIALMSHAIASAHQVLSGADYDVEELTYLGQLGVTYKGFMVPKSLELPERSFQGLIERSQERPLLWGQAGAATDFLVMREILRENGVNLNVDEVVFEGTSEEVASMLRGEVEVIWTTLSSLVEETENHPELEVIGTTACERQVSAPDLPTIVEEGIPGAEEICELADGSGRVFAAPAGVPEGTAAALREALSRAIQDPEHVAAALEGGVEIVYADHTAQEAIAPEYVELYTRYKDILAEQSGG